MAADGPHGGDGERDWRDRDTEPIPRARSEPPRPDPPSATDDGPDRQGADESTDAPAAGHDDPDPYGTDRYDPDPFEDRDGYADPDSLDGPGRYRDAAHAAVTGGPDDATHDHGRLHESFPDAHEPRARGKPRPYRDEPGEFVDDPGAFPDDPSRYRDDYPEDFVEAPSGARFAGSSTVGASYAVGDFVEPLTEDELGGLRGGATPLVTSRRVVPLEDEASPLVQRYLFPTEKFRGEWRRHPIELAKEVGIAAGATVVMGLLAGYLTRSEVSEQVTTFLVLGWFAVLVWVAWQIADWWYDRFILTNKRVMVVSGIITRNVAMMPLQRVTDMKYVQSPLGRMLNYGTFELESAGQDQALRSIPHLPSPNELYLRIVEEMYEPEAVEARLAGAQDVIDDGT